MRILRALSLLLALASLVCLAGCGGSDGKALGGADEPSGPSRTAASEPPPATTPTPSSAVAEGTTDVLGEAGSFAPGGNGATLLDAQIKGRECVLTDPLFGSCRASTGAGGQFLVTMESTVEAPTVWNVVARCGAEPSLPAASAHGDFQPVTSDLGLDPYGEVLGVTLVGEVAEAALVYQPEGSGCPLVWGLGEVDRANLFTGGLDALNGDSDPIAFTDAQGVRTCAVADGKDGISLSPCA